MNKLISRLVSSILIINVLLSSILPNLVFARVLDNAGDNPPPPAGPAPESPAAADQPAANTSLLNEELMNQAAGSADTTPDVNAGAARMWEEMNQGTQPAQTAPAQVSQENTNVDRGDVGIPAGSVIIPATQPEPTPKPPSNYYSESSYYSQGSYYSESSYYTPSQSVQTPSGLHDLPPVPSVNPTPQSAASCPWRGPWGCTGNCQCGGSYMDKACSDEVTPCTCNACPEATQPPPSTGLHDIPPQSQSAPSSPVTCTEGVTNCVWSNATNSCGSQTCYRYLTAAFSADCQQVSFTNNTSTCPTSESAPKPDCSGDNYYGQGCPGYVAPSAPAPSIENERRQEIAYEESHPAPTLAPVPQGGTVNVVTDNASQQAAVASYNNQGSSYEKDHDNAYTEVRANLNPPASLAQAVEQVPDVAANFVSTTVVDPITQTIEKTQENAAEKAKNAEDQRLGERLHQANSSFEQANAANNKTVEDALNAPPEKKISNLAAVFGISTNNPVSQQFSNISDKFAGLGINISGDPTNFSISLNNQTVAGNVQPGQIAQQVQQGLGNLTNTVNESTVNKSPAALLTPVAPLVVGLNVASYLSQPDVVASLVTAGYASIKKDFDGINKDAAKLESTHEILADSIMENPPGSYDHNKVAPVLYYEAEIKAEIESGFYHSIQEALDDNPTRAGILKRFGATTTHIQNFVNAKGETRNQLDRYSQQQNDLAKRDADVAFNIATTTVLNLAAGPVLHAVGGAVGSVAPRIVRPLADVLEPAIARSGGVVGDFLDGTVGRVFKGRVSSEGEQVVVSTGDRVVTEQVMKDYNLTPDTIVYRVTPKEYVKDGVICGNPESCALIRDVYNPVENPRYADIIAHGLPPGDFPKTIGPLVDASSLEVPSLNVAVVDPSLYARGKEGYVKVGIRLGDILDQGGKIYPDVVGAAGLKPLIVTTPEGGVKVVSAIDLATSNVVPEAKQVAAQNGAQEAQQLFQSQFENKVAEKTGGRITGENARFTSTGENDVSINGDNVMFWGVPIREGEIPPRINNINLKGQKGQGLGSALVHSYEETIAEKGYSVTSIQHVVPEAEGFWRKMGYAPVDIPGNERRINAVWIKPLTKDAEAAIAEIKQDVASKLYENHNNNDALGDFLEILRWRTSCFLKDKPSRNEIIKAVNEVNQELNPKTLSQPGKKTSFWQKFIKEVLADEKGSNSSVAIDSQNYELLVKQKIIKNRLAKGKEVTSVFVKNTLTTDVISQEKIDTVNGYILTTNSTGISQSKISEGLYKVEITPMDGVDIQTIGTIKVDSVKQIILPIAVSQGSGKVTMLQGSQSEEKGMSGDSSNLKVFVFSDSNKNGSLDNNEKVLAWAGMQAHLTRLDRTQSLLLSSGWNLVTLSALPPQPLTASKLLGQIASQGGYATTVSTLSDGAWKSYVKRGENDYSGDDFVIEVGKAYFVKVLKPLAFKFAGQEFVAPIKTKLTSGWNTVGLPKTKKSYKASSLIDEINTKNGGADAASRWQYSLWDTLVKKNQQKYGRDFAIENNKGYLIRSDKEGEFEF